MDGDSFSSQSRSRDKEITLHVRFHQTEARLQQEVLGNVGVNLVYGAFYKNNEPKNYCATSMITSIKMPLKLIPLILKDHYLKMLITNL